MDDKQQESGSAKPFDVVITKRQGSNNDLLGLQLADHPDQPGEVIVDKLVALPNGETSPLKKKGVQEGDRLHSVNGHELDDMDLDDIDRALRKSHGDLTLTFLRAADEEGGGDDNNDAEKSEDGELLSGLHRLSIQQSNSSDGVATAKPTAAASQQQQQQQQQQPPPPAAATPAASWGAWSRATLRGDGPASSPAVDEASALRRAGEARAQVRAAGVLQRMMVAKMEKKQGRQYRAEVVAARTIQASWRRHWVRRLEWTAHALADTISAVAIGATRLRKEKGKTFTVYQVHGTRLNGSVTMVEQRYSGFAALDAKVRTERGPATAVRQRRRG